MRGRLTWAFAVVGLSGLLQISSCSNVGGAPASYDPRELALVRLEPADGESSVPRNRVVRMFFNTQVLPESVDDQSILVRIGGTLYSRVLLVCPDQIATQKNSRLRTVMLLER